MTKLLAYSGADGVACIVVPVRWRVVEIDPETGAATERDETDAEMLARVRERDVPEAVEPVELDAAALPTDRELRAAWRLDKGAVVENRDAAAAWATAKGAAVEPGDDVATIKAKVRAL